MSNSSVLLPKEKDVPMGSNGALRGAFKRIAGFREGCTAYSDSTGEPGYSDYTDYTDCPGE